jgi:hypothetical protein
LITQEFNITGVLLPTSSLRPHFLGRTLGALRSIGRTNRQDEKRNEAQIVTNLADNKNQLSLYSKSKVEKVQIFVAMKQMTHLRLLF